MKRKGSRRSGKSDADTNGVEPDEELDSSEEPQEKKGRKSKGKKSKGKAAEAELERESGQSDEDVNGLETRKEDSNSNQEKKGRKSKGRKSKQDQDTETASAGEESGQSDEDVSGLETRKEDNQEKKGRKSKGRKSKQDQDAETASDREEVSEEADPLAGDDDAEYEVEKILEDKLVKGVRHYLIRWKGYTEESDTWEPEHTLDCDHLMKDYKENKKKEKPKQGKSKKKGGKEKKEKGPKESFNENEDFEVDRIIDVYFHRDGKKDFLVSWKGYPSSENSWEPEDNMDCKDLIKKFMDKVKEAKKFEAKEAKLRINPKPVNRLEFSMHEKSRRLSKRRSGKDRVHYFDAE